MGRNWGRRPLGREVSRGGRRAVGRATSDCLGTDSAGTGPTIPVATGPVRWTVASRAVRRRSAPWPGGSGIAGRRPPRRQRPSGRPRDPRESVNGGRGVSWETAPARTGPVADPSGDRPGGPSDRMGSIRAPRDRKSVTPPQRTGKRKIRFQGDFRRQARTVTCAQFVFYLSTRLSTALRHPSSRQGPTNQHLRAVGLWQRGGCGKPSVVLEMARLLRHATRRRV